MRCSVTVFVRSDFGNLWKAQGANFDSRLNVPFHSDELALAGILKRPEESLSDVVRVAVREWIRRESAKRMVGAYVRFAEPGTESES